MACQSTPVYELYRPRRWCSNQAVKTKTRTEPRKLPKGGDTLPLYRQVKRDLQKIIEAGHYGPGKALPGEPAQVGQERPGCQCRRRGCSRATATIQEGGVSQAPPRGYARVP